jgi:transcriptional regulator with XRE-family HTH domain
LADARRRAGFDQQTFADELGVTKHTVSQWETGATGIRARRRAPMALLLDISLTELDRLISGASLAGAFDPLGAAGSQASLQARPGQGVLIVVCPVRRPGPYVIRFTWPIRVTNARR